MKPRGQNPPAWLRPGNRLLWPILRRARAAVDERKSGDLSLDFIPSSAVIHLIDCLQTSIETNVKGRHAVAISLVRQCVEALTLVEIGLQQPAYRNPILHDWRDQSKKPGELRKILERDVWPTYGTGLWKESWAEFAGEFARAVQPYAHYTQLLQGWQLAVASGNKLHRGQDGHYIFIAKLGINTYDPVKATRITLLHCLLVWVVARILAANHVSNINASDVALLGNQLANSDLLGREKVTWHQQFWPHMFDGPKGRKGKRV